MSVAISQFRAGSLFSSPHVVSLCDFSYYTLTFGILCLSAMRMMFVKILLAVFLIMIADIDKDVSASKLISFADDTRLYSGVGDVTDCDNLDTVYDWASSNNMF